MRYSAGVLASSSSVVAALVRPQKNVDGVAPCPRNSEEDERAGGAPGASHADGMGSKHVGRRFVLLVELPLDVVRDERHVGVGPVAVGRPVVHALLLLKATGKLV